MSVKEVRRFLDETKNKKEFSEFIREKLNGEFFSEEQINGVVEKEIIPFARKHNFDVTKADFEKFATHHVSGPLELDLDDLEDVVGGKSLFVKSAFSMFLCLTEVAGFVSSNFAHASGNPITSVQESHDQNTEEKIFEISDIKSGNYNPDEVTKIRMSGSGYGSLGEKFPNLKTVIISNDFEPAYEWLGGFLNDQENLKNIEIEGNNKQYVFSNGILYNQYENNEQVKMRKVWISDEVKEVSLSQCENMILNPNRAYTNLKKINLTKDFRTRYWEGLLNFIKKNKDIKISVDSGNKDFKIKDGKLYYLSIDLPVGCNLEEIEDLNLFGEIPGDVNNFKNLKTITLHSNFEGYPYSLLTLLNSNDNVSLRVLDGNKAYKFEDGVLYYKNIPIWGSLDKIESIDLSGKIESQLLKNLKNLKTINIRENCEYSPGELRRLILNNPKANVFLLDNSGNNLNETENYRYDENGILYHKETGLPIFGNLDKIKELTFKNIEYTYFSLLETKNIIFKNLETVRIGKEFPSYDLNSLKHFLDRMPNVKSVEVDEENPYYYSENGVLKNKQTKQSEWDSNETNDKNSSNKKLIDLLPKTYQKCKPYLEIRKAGKYKNPETEYRNISDELKIEISKQVIKILKGLVKSSSLSMDEQIDNMSQEEVNDALRDLNEQLKNRTNKAHAIYDWIADNFSYNDDDVTHNINQDMRTCRNHPAQVFKNKYGVCRGFARLANVMLRLADVPSIYVGSYYDNIEKASHAFNLIFTGEGELGDWALMDATWGMYKKVNVPLEKLDYEIYNKEGEINESYFPQENVLASNRYIANEKTESHHISNFRLRKYNANGEIMKFKIDDSHKRVSAKSPSFMLDGENFNLPEEIKSMEGFILEFTMFDADSYNKIKTLDLRGMKIKLESNFFRYNNFKKSDIKVDEESIYKWKDGVLYDNDGTMLTVDNEAQKIRLSSDIKEMVFSNKNFSNLKEIEIDKTFSNDSLKYFLNCNKQIEHIKVEEGNSEYSYNEEEGVLYYKNFPIWGKFENIKTIQLSEDCNYLSSDENAYPNLERIVLKKDLYARCSSVRDFILKFPGAKLEVESGENFFLKDDKKLYHKSVDVPLLEDLEKIESLNISKGSDDFLNYYGKNLNNLKTLNIEKDCDAPSYVLEDFLNLNKQIIKVNVINNPLYVCENEVLYRLQGEEKVPVYPRNQITSFTGRNMISLKPL